MVSGINQCNSALNAITPAKGETISSVQITVKGSAGVKSVVLTEASAGDLTDLVDHICLHIKEQESKLERELGEI